MNERYFGNLDDHHCVDAGYRWAYWLLEEPGIVALGQDVNVESVLAAEKYWNPPPEERSPWLVDKVLPRVRAFLEQHRNARIVYIDFDRIVLDEEEGVTWHRPAD